MKRFAPTDGKKHRNFHFPSFFLVFQYVYFFSCSIVFFPLFFFFCFFLLFLTEDGCSVVSGLQAFAAFMAVLSKANGKTSQPNTDRDLIK